MSKSYSRAAAKILVQLGLPYSVYTLDYYISRYSLGAAWSYLIEDNDIFYTAAILNRITKPLDIDRYISDINYAGMRSTYPSRSHGRTIIGPRVTPITELIEQGKLDLNNLMHSPDIICSARTKDQCPAQDATQCPARSIGECPVSAASLAALNLPYDASKESYKYIQKYPTPTAPKMPEDITGRSIYHKKLGHGIIEDMSSGFMTIVFDNGDRKHLSYTYCKDNDLISFPS